jgi:hypothetical protein
VLRISATAYRTAKLVVHERSRVPRPKLSHWLKVRISAVDDDRLRATASSHNMNVSAFVRTALTERLELESILDRERATNGESATG